MSSRDSRISTAQILFPLSLVSFVLFLTLAYQTTQVMRDRAVLHDAKQQQDAVLENANKVQAQLEALATGTAKLAQDGNKNAQAIVAQLKQAGITIGNQQQQAPAAPAADSDAAPAAPAAPSSAQ